MKIKNNQSLLDVAISATGDVTSVWEYAEKLDVSLSDDVVAGVEVCEFNANVYVLAELTARSTTPATGLSGIADINELLSEGI